jgi:hypothetical protein
MNCYQWSHWCDSDSHCQHCPSFPSPLAAEPCSTLRTNDSTNTVIRSNRRVVNAKWTPPQQQKTMTPFCLHACMLAFVCLLLRTTCAWSEKREAKVISLTFSHTLSLPQLDLMRSIETVLFCFVLLFISFEKRHKKFFFE